MRIVFISLLFTASLGIEGIGQSASPSNGASSTRVVAVLPEAKAAQSALEAHGGAKLKAMKTLVLRGSVDVTTSAINQAIPATFSIAISGEKYLIDIQNPFQPLKQVFDGKDTHSSIAGFSLPPVTSLGFPLLPKIGDAGYSITPLPETAKKKKGFRMTTPDGFYTDFYLDEKTNQVKGYESSYEIRGRLVTTVVEIDKYKIVEGITVPERYAQRFDLGQMTAYANFKSKEILINTAISDEVFTLGK
jgi:hypothetical protein